jgi:hypothetical protein
VGGKGEAARADIWRHVLRAASSNHARLLVSLAATLGLVIATSAVPEGSRAATPPRAHVWVDKSGGSCRRRAVPRRYVNSRACRSLRAAYRVASAGDRIMVKAGTYGRQVLPGGSKRLVIRKAPGPRPVLGTTTVNASNVTLIGFNIRRNDDPGPNTATLEAIGARNRFKRIRVNTRFRPVRQGIYAHGNRNVFKNGSTFNVVDEKGALVTGSHITFVNFKFHDVRVTGPLVHNECVYSSGPNLTVRRSHFWRCATMDLFITRGDWWNQPAYGGVTIENNVFEHSTMEGRRSWHHFGLLLGGQLNFDGAPLRNFKVRYNTFEQAVSLNSSFRATGRSQWVGNVGGGWDCIPGMVFRHNVGKKCSRTDKRVSPSSSCGPPACATRRTAAYRWVNPARHNFHLRARSPAINRGDRNDFPATDKDGKRRRGRPEAGAYEYRRR